MSSPPDPSRHRLLGRIPEPVSRRLRVLRRPGAAIARSRILRSLDPGTPPDRSTLARLKEAWGGGAVADVDYLLEVSERARAARRPILECGSGLTTLLLGIYATVPVHSLEESAEWTARMRSALRWYGLGSVELDLAPIVDHGGVEWYTIPPLPPVFDLVVCDGPISHRKPGSPRSGLIPLLEGHLDHETVILLDDIGRPSEQMALAAWEAHGFAATSASRESRDFAIVTRSAVSG